MVHISKHKLDSSVSAYFKNELVELFIANTTKRDFGSLLFELLSPTEQIMFQKRVGILVLLVNGYSAHEISQLLKVSTSTIWHLESQLEKGNYDHIRATLARKKARESIVHFLGNIMALGFPGVASKRLREKIKHDAVAWRAGGK